METVLLPNQEDTLNRATIGTDNRRIFLLGNDSGVYLPESSLCRALKGLKFAAGAI